VESLWGWGALLLLISLPGLLAPREVWSFTAGLSYRTPERVVPSNRRFRIARMGSGTLAIIGAVVMVGGLWPGDPRAKALAFFWAAIIGIGLFVSLVILSIVRRKRAAARLDQLPPDEPSELSYGIDYLSIVVYLVLLLVVAGAVLSLSQQPTAEEQANQPSEPLDPATQRQIDELSESMSTVHITRYPVFTDLPEGSALALPGRYELLDAQKRLPKAVWDESEQAGAGMDVAEADLVLTMPSFSCTVTGLIVQETETTVSVALVVANPAVEGTAVADCFSPVLHTDYYLVDLASPVGDREVVQFGGDRTLSQR